MNGYSLRQMDVDDKVCDQVDFALVEQVYPKEVIERCVGESLSWTSKRRRLRQTTVVTLVWLIIAMALWSHLNQALVWQKLVGKLSALHPKKDAGHLSASGVSGRRKELGDQGMREILAERCVVIADPGTMPWAFFGRYRLMGIDGTLFRIADTACNEQGFGRGSNQYGKSAYPQVRVVLLVECGTHAVVRIEISRYDVSEVHGAYHLLDMVGANMLVTMDAGITSGGFLERVRERKAHALGALEAGAWEKAPKRRRLSDGSVLVWIAPNPKGDVCYPVQKGLWVRIISYRLTDDRLGEPGRVYRLVTTLLNPVTAPARDLIELYHERWEVELVIDEIKTHERVQHKVLRSKTPEGITQELYGIFLAHYLVRVLMAQAALKAGQDPDRLGFTEGLFHVCEMIDLALLLPSQAAPALRERLYEKLVQHPLPVRKLRINRREIKQVYNKYKPKKRDLPAPKPFEPHERFLDFVDLLDPLVTCVSNQKGA